MATQRQRSESLIDDSGIWFGIALGLVIGTFLVAGLAGLDATSTAVAVILVGGLAAARLPGLIALVLGGIVWAFFTGFTENDFGQLTFARGDLARLVAFSLATGALAQVLRHGPDRGVMRHG